MKQQTLAINASKHPTNEDKKKNPKYLKWS
jgi:hypothetical protein